MKKKLISSILLMLIVLTTAVPFVHAEGDDPGVSDLFLTGNNIDVNYPVEGDLYAAGNYVNILDDINGDLIVGGNMVSVESAVGQNIRAGGNFVSLNNVEAQNLTIFGQSIRLNHIQVNNVYAIGQMIAFSGTAHDVYINGYSVTIDGTISGTSEIYANSVVIKESANITGTLNIHSKNDITYEGNVDKQNITYTKTFFDNDYEYDYTTEEPTPPVFSFSRFTWKFVKSLATLYVTSLLILLIFPKATALSVENLKKNTFKPVLLGLVLAAATPALIVLVSITIVGIPLGIIATLLFAMLIIITKSYAALAVAKIAFPKMNQFLSLLIAATIFVIISYIPIVNFLVWVISAGYTFGSLILFFNKNEEIQKPHKELETVKVEEE